MEKYNNKKYRLADQLEIPLFLRPLVSEQRSHRRILVPGLGPSQKLGAFERKKKDKRRTIDGRRVFRLKFLFLKLLRRIGKIGSTVVN